MNPEQQWLTEQLDIWTAAESEKKSGRGRSAGNGSNGSSVYGVKKLRELILELAVRGKLVPQDLSDEPASELLKRIQAEKAKLIAEGKIKKDKPLPPISDEEKPFDLPQGWEWVRLGDISSAVQYGYTDSANHQSRDVLFLRITDIQDDIVNWATVPGCNISLSDSDNYLLENNDLVIARTGGTIGKSYLVTGLDQKAVFASYLIRIGNLSSTSAEYKKVFLGSILYWDQLIASSMGTGQPNVNGTALKNLIFSLPPLSEQHRIVAKVDELMVLCDQLETQHINAAQAHEKLVNHLLDTLTQSQSAEEFNANWQRIAAHFDTLFTTEASIDALKQTLLQLAVMGKLVPQDPNDEPASELLKRIQAEKVKLIAEGKIKKGKPLPPISDEEKPFEMPEGWEWVRLTDLVALVTDGDHQAPPKAKSGVPFLIIGNLNTGNISFESCRFVPEEYYQKLDWGKRPNKNDLLYTVTGSYGIPIKVDVSEKFCVQRHVAILKTAQSTPINYLKLLLESKYALQYASEIATGIAQKTVPLTGLRIMPIAMPTEAQQKRIVDKVDELMALCDQLKGRITESGQLHQKLADVAVGQALSS